MEENYYKFYKSLDLRKVNCCINGDTLGRPAFHGKMGQALLIT